MSRSARILLAAVLAAGPGAAFANSFDGWWQDAAGEERFRLRLGGEGVGDTVEHAPNANGGGFEPVRTLPRFLGAELALTWLPSRAWTLHAELGQRSLTSMRDRYEVTAYALGAARRLPSPHRATRLDLVLELAGNRAAELYKNSWTEVGAGRLTEARLFDARDRSLSLALATRTLVRPRLTVSALLGVGWTRSEHGRLSAVGSDARGCRYGIEAADGKGRLALLESCDQLLALEERYPDERGMKRRLDFAPSEDLTQQAVVMRAGLGVGYRIGAADLTLAWRRSLHERVALDRRIEAAGGATVDTNDLLSLQADYRASRRLRLHASVQRRSTAYLDELPLLYSRFTSARFASDTLSFGLGASLSF